MYGYIYKITNLVNGKIYIGKAFDIKKRFKEHIQRAMKGFNSCPYLYYSIRKYGPENFKIEELDRSTFKEELNFLERYYIQLYDARNHEIGYNIARGGDGGTGWNIDWTLKRREIQSQKRKERWKTDPWKVCSNSGMRKILNLENLSEFKYVKSEDVGEYLSSGKWILSTQYWYDSHKVKNPHNSGTIAMTGPDGKKKMVFSEEIDFFIKSGYKIGDPKVGYNHTEETKEKMRHPHKKMKSTEKVGKSHLKYIYIYENMRFKGISEIKKYMDSINIHISETAIKKLAAGKISNRKMSASQMFPELVGKITRERIGDYY